MGGSARLIIGSFDSGFGDDFFFNGFAPVMTVFEWVYSGGSGDDFFFNGFALVASVMIFFEWVCSDDNFFDRWPGFQIGSVGF